MREREKKKVKTKKNKIKIDRYIYEANLAMVFGEGKS